MSNVADASRCHPYRQTSVGVLDRPRDQRAGEPLLSASQDQPVPGSSGRPGCWRGPPGRGRESAQVAVEGFSSLEMGEACGAGALGHISRFPLPVFSPADPVLRAAAGVPHPRATHRGAGESMKGLGSSGHRRALVSLFPGFSMEPIVSTF